MIVYIKNNNMTDGEFRLNSIQLTAFHRLALIDWRTVDKFWHEQCKKEFNTSLQKFYTRLISQANYEINQDKDIVVTFTDKRAEKFAHFMTYGNRTQRGVNILKLLFKK